MARFERTTEYWPLFVTVVPHQFFVRDVDDYIADVMSIYERRERFASLIVTAPTAVIPGAAERKRLADWQNETIESIRRYNVVTATVISSPIIRAAMSAMNWVFRPPNEQLVVETFDEAFSRCVARLREEGCEFSPALERAAREYPRSERALLGPESHGL